MVVMGGGVSCWLSVVSLFRLRTFFFRLQPRRVLTLTLGCCSFTAATPPPGVGGAHERVLLSRREQKGGAAPRLAHIQPL
jgi:hypothetical protein